MARIYRSLTDLIGHTPLLELRGYQKQYGLPTPILAKLELFNPAGSAKDRVALSMIEDAERRGVLQPGGTIIEPTSGNTGIGLAAVATARGYQAIIVMPDSMSRERIALMEAYGARVVLTPGALGMTGCIEKANELKESTENSFIPDQFANPANPSAHYTSTGPEIWADTDGKVDIFVAGVGTGGTISGVGKYLKEKNPAVKIVAVEPAASPLLSQGKAAPHGIQGIGANFIPAALDRDIYDEVIPVTDADACRTAKEIARTEGILVGISSGAAVWAAAELARRPEHQGKTIVALLPDTGEHYLSNHLFD